MHSVWAQKKKIVHGRGLSNLNLGIFVCSFDICRASKTVPSINYVSLGGFQVTHPRELIWLQTIDRALRTTTSTNTYTSPRNWYNFAVSIFHLVCLVKCYRSIILKINCYEWLRVKTDNERFSMTCSRPPPQMKPQILVISLRFTP